MAVAVVLEGNGRSSLILWERKGRLGDNIVGSRFGGE